MPGLRVAGALLVLACSLVAGRAAASVFPRLPASCHAAAVPSGGVTVRAALCLPPRATRSAAAIVLHGCGGFDTFDHRLAVALPAAGIATLYLDYFGPTPPPGRRGFCGGPPALGTAFPVWERVVADAAGVLRADAAIDPRRIALVGWSLGGGLALATALAHPHLFDALVGFSTGLPARVRLPGAAALPPTLLLSGGAHDAIPLSETENLVRVLRAAHVPVSLFVYRDGVHSWPGRQGAAGIAAAERFLRRF